MIRPRSELLFLALLLGAAPAHADTSTRRSTAVATGPYAVAIEGGVAFGLFFATHGKVVVSVGRRFWDRLDVEGAFRLDRGRDLFGVEGAGRVGLLLPVAARWDALLGWRVGYSWFRLQMPGRILWTEAVSVSVVIGARYLVAPRLELRFSPVVVTGYWNELWGMTIEPGVGVAYRF